MNALLPFFLVRRRKHKVDAPLESTANYLPENAEVRTLADVMSRGLAYLHSAPVQMDDVGHRVERNNKQEKSSPRETCLMAQAS